MSVYTASLKGGCVLVLLSCCGPLKGLKVSDPLCVSFKQLARTEIGFEPLAFFRKMCPDTKQWAP